MRSTAHLQATLQRLQRNLAKPNVPGWLRSHLHRELTRIQNALARSQQ